MPLLCPVWIWHIHNHEFPDIWIPEELHLHLGLVVNRDGDVFLCPGNRYFSRTTLFPLGLSSFSVSDLAFLCTSPLESSLETWFVPPSLFSFLLPQFWEINPSSTLCFLMILEPVGCSLWVLLLELWTTYNTTITISKSRITLVLFFVSQRQRGVLKKLPKNQVTSTEWCLKSSGFFAKHPHSF